MSQILDISLRLNSSIEKSLERKVYIVSADDIPVLNDSDRHSIAITATILFTLALILNTFALLTYFRRKLRPLFRTCLISLTCSDLFTSIFLYTLCMSQVTQEYVSVWRLGDILCSFIPFITTAAILVNSLILAGIALDRYLAIVKFVKGTWNPSTLFSASCAVLIWGFAAGIASPLLSSYYFIDILIVSSSQDKSEPAKACVCKNKEMNRYYYTVVFATIFLPFLMVFLWLYFIIAREIWQRRRPIHVVSGSASDSTSKCTKSNETVKTDQTNLKKPQPVQHVNGNDTSGIGASGISVIIPTTTSSSSTENKSELPSKNESTVAAEAKMKRSKSRREIRQIRMFGAILCLMTTFLICRLPSWIVILYATYNDDRRNVIWLLKYWLGLLSMTNCILNPLLYTFLTETIQVSLNCFERLRRHMHACCPIQ